MHDELGLRGIHGVMQGVIDGKQGAEHETCKVKHDHGNHWTTLPAVNYGIKSDLWNNSITNIDTKRIRRTI